MEGSGRHFGGFRIGWSLSQELCSCDVARVAAAGIERWVHSAIIDVMAPADIHGRQAEGMWMKCLDLAWRSYADGAVPVGCVITDGEGAVVAQGRNRFLDHRSTESTDSRGRVGPHVAHAEMNALAQLPPDDYPSHVLWSSLEPCFMCTTATLHTHVGRIMFGASDPLMEGVSDLPRISPWIRERWAPRVGPEGGAVAVVSGALVATWHHKRGDQDLGRLVARVNGAERLAAEILDGRSVVSLAAAVDWYDSNS